MPDFAKGIAVNQDGNNSSAIAKLNSVGRFVLQKPVKSKNKARAWISNAAVQVSI
jgi:hypothetical protein